jgi:hypothetical protein
MSTSQLSARTDAAPPPAAMSLNGSATAGAAGTRQVTSADRLLMYGIERWPSNPEGYWQSKMSDARIAAIQAGLDPDLVKTAAGMGITRLVRDAERFQARMFEKIRVLVSGHEIPVSEVMQEMQYRIAKVRSDFDLTWEQVGRAVVVGLTRYADDGGSPEFAIGLADLMGIAEEKRCFLRLAVDL